MHLFYSEINVGDYFSLQSLESRRQFVTLLFCYGFVGFHVRRTPSAMAGMVDVCNAYHGRHGEQVDTVNTEKSTTPGSSILIRQVHRFRLLCSLTSSYDAACSPK